MRISDWSSDVCSSDLIYRDPSVTVRVERSRDTRRNSTIPMGISTSLDANGKEDGPKKNRRPMGAAGLYLTPLLSSGRPSSARAGRAAPCGSGYAARQSVVDGQSVSVRVDTGGDCILKKK